MMSLQRLLKEAFDVGFTLIATLVLLPLGLLVGLLVRLSSPGPALYRPERVGKGGHRFLIYKYRTMVDNAVEIGPAVTHRNDPRITRIGRILRKTKFDEFPQVINVLRGEMSIVGPRPELPTYVAFYTPEQNQVLCMKPGLTSLAQVVYREEDSLLPEKDTEAYYSNKVLPRKTLIT